MDVKTGKYPKKEKQFVTRFELLKVISAEIIKRKNHDLDSYSNYIRLRFEGNSDVKLKIVERFPILSDSIIDTFLSFNNISKRDNDLLVKLIGIKVEALTASSNNWKSAIIVGFTNSAEGD